MTSTMRLIKLEDSIHDIIAIGHNFKVTFIEGETVQSSLDFIESGCSPTNWAIYLAPRCPI